MKGGVKQREIAFPNGWGGRRKGAGRPNLSGSTVTHLSREALASRFPVLVTMKLCEGLPSMRTGAAYSVLAQAFEKARERAGRLETGVFRLVHYSVQGDHLHLICEAKNRESLVRGLQGLAVRIAKGLNRLWERKGKLFAERYHDRILRTPTQVRNTLRYVLNNAYKHGLEPNVQRPDLFTSGPWFDGWRDYVPGGLMTVEAPIARAKTWLLSIGWRKRGRIGLTDLPAT